MIGGLLKGMGSLVKGAFKGIGKGISKGFKLLGKGAKKLWRTFTKTQHTAHTEVNEDSKDKKKLSQNGNKFSEEILEENHMTPARETKEQTQRKLAEEFSLTPEEISYLSGLDKSQFKSNEIKPHTVNAEDPSIIDADEYVDYEEIKDTNTFHTVQNQPVQATSNPVEIEVKTDSNNQDLAKPQPNVNIVNNYNSSSRSEENVVNTDNANPIEVVIPTSNSNNENNVVEGNTINSDNSSSNSEVQVILPNQNNYNSSSRSEENVVNTDNLNGILEQHIYIDEPDYHYPFQYTEQGLAPMLPAVAQLIYEMVSNPLREEIMQRLNQMYSATTDIEIAGQKTQLATLNQLNKNINDNMYLFLQQSMPMKNLVYERATNIEKNTDQLRAIIGRFLVSKNGEIALTPELAANLTLLPVITDTTHALQAQVETLDSKVNRAEEQHAEESEEDLNTKGEQSSKLDNILGFFSGITGFFKSILGKLNLIPGPMDILFLILLAVDQIKKYLEAHWNDIMAWFNDTWGDLTLEGIGNLIWTTIKKWVGNLTDILKYLFMEYIKKEGKFFWNGGDFYFKYNKARNDGSIYEYSSWTDDNEKVVRRYDQSGKLTSGSVNDVTYSRDGQVNQYKNRNILLGLTDYGGNKYDYKSDAKGVQQIKSKSKFFLNAEVPLQDPAYLYGSVNRVDDFKRKDGQPVYRLGGPYTVFADYLWDLDNSKWEDNLKKANQNAYVYITRNSKGQWVAFIPTGKSDTSKEAANLFNHLKVGDNILENVTTAHKRDGSEEQIVTTGLGGTMKDNITEMLNILERTYNKLTTVYNKDMFSKFGGDAQIVNGRLQTSGLSQFDNSTFSYDANGMISSAGGSIADNAKITNHKRYQYSQSKRSEIFNGGSYADCSSYVTYVLSKSGINLTGNDAFGYIPSTADYTNLIRNSSDKARSINKRYGIKVIERVGKRGVKPNEAKLQPGDISVFRDNDAGHVIMYLGGGTWTHMGQEGNRTFTLQGNDWTNWTSTHAYQGTLRFGHSNRKDIYGTSINLGGTGDAGNTSDLATVNKNNPVSEGAEEVIHPRNSQEYGRTKDNAAHAFNYFRVKGLSPNAAAGIVGNLACEDLGRPAHIVPDDNGGPTAGIAGFHDQFGKGGLFTKLQQFSNRNNKDWRSLNAQLDFIWDMIMVNPLNYGRKYLTLQKYLTNPTISVREASYQWGKLYEVFGPGRAYLDPNSKEHLKRAKTANGVLVDFGKLPPQDILDTPVMGASYESTGVETPTSGSMTSVNGTTLTEQWRSALGQWLKEVESTEPGVIQAEPTPNLTEGNKLDEVVVTGQSVPIAKTVTPEPSFQGVHIPEIIAEEDPKIKQAREEAAKQAKEAEKARKHPELAKKQGKSDVPPVILQNHTHNYPTPRQDYQVNPDAFLNTNNNDA